jgi:hypothetical protein
VRHVCEMLAYGFAAPAFGGWPKVLTPSSSKTTCRATQCLRAGVTFVCKLIDALHAGCVPQLPERRDPPLVCPACLATDPLERWLNESRESG